MPADAQDATAVRLTGRVYKAESGAPVEGAIVELKRRGRRTSTDSIGRFLFTGLRPGTVSVRITRLGYAPAETTLRLTSDRAVHTLVVRLRPRPIRLRPLTVRARRMGGGVRARVLFEREPRTGVVGVSRRELKAIPALIAPDVLRSLQALPGVVQLNSLSAQLYVRGGGPDQNLFLLGGARIFAPYHMFGIFGVFNPDAVGRVTFYRGSVPARYGGALSSVVRIEPRGGSEAFHFGGGVSLHGVRGTARGSLSSAEAEWLVAGRRTHVDLISQTLFGYNFPYAFHDLQAHLSLVPAPRHTFEATFFTSEDRFEMFLGGASGNLHSRWGNTVGSLRWRWNPEGDWSVAATAWGSGYGGELVTGAAESSTVGDAIVRLTTTSRVRVGGLRLEAAWRGEKTGVRFGLDLEGGAVALTGDEKPGSYLMGEVRGTYLLPAAYVEFERWLGPVRLAPGLRLGYEISGGRLLLAPRLSARYYLSEDWSVTVGAGRTHQLLSTLRDARYPLPGAPLWFLRPEGAPVSITDALSAELKGWWGNEWSLTASVYGKRFQDLPRWRPVGRRTLDSGLSYDDGRALGAEFMVRKHAGRVTGWLGYGFSRVRLRDAETGEHYYAPWDRRHSVDAALFVRLWEELSFSGRLTYGTGMPFWPLVGSFHRPRFQPISTKRPLGTIPGIEVPVWDEEQMRFPAYFRLDLGVRYGFELWSAQAEAYAGVLNITGRENVLTYRIQPKTERIGGPIVDTMLLPYSTFSTLLPTVGIDVHF